MDTATYKHVLQQCRNEANTLKCAIADWSEIGGIEGLLSIQNQRQVHKLYQEAWLKCYQEYHQTIWGTVFFNLLGEKLLSYGRKLNVLDVGCATSQVFRSLFQQHPNMSREMCSYVSIDKCPELNDIISEPYIEITLADAHRRRDLRWVAEHCDRKHIMMDVFDTDCHIDMCLNTQDIIIIDIEPHGKEWDVYERFLPYMKPCHIVILKCVAYIDLFGPQMALNFISKVEESNAVRIYDTVEWLLTFGADFNNRMNVYPRDLVFVMSKM